MIEKVNKLISFLKDEDKESALNLCISYLEEKKLSVIELYELILTPALNNIIMEYEGDDDNLIWNEHVRSGIIRSIVECVYPYVLKEKKELGIKDMGKVIVMCPRFEDHELGARMVSDFFTIAGYDTTFIGANTPEKTIINAIQAIQPKYISMSVTNYYNLVATKKTIDHIKDSVSTDIKFLLGGYAFTSNPNAYKEVGGDLLLRSFNDIINLSKGDESN